MNLPEWIYILLAVIAMIATYFFRKSFFSSTLVSSEIFSASSENRSELTKNLYIQELDEAEARRMTNKRYRAVKEAHQGHLQQFTDKTPDEIRLLMKDKIYKKSMTVNGYKIRIETQNHLNLEDPHVFVTTCPDTLFGSIFRLEDKVSIK